MDKLRNRSEQELVQQGRSLAELRDLLIHWGITPILSGGTFLGVMREGDFIRWDWDAEFTVFYDEVAGKTQRVVEELVTVGFSLRKAQDDRRCWKIEAERSGFLFEVRAWYRSGEHLKRDLYKVPAHFFERLTTCKLRGETYLCPEDADAYLTYVYGDWKVPRRTANKKEYLTHDFFCSALSGHTLSARIIRRVLRSLDRLRRLCER